MNCFCEPRSTESTKCVPSQALLTWIVYMDLRLVPAVVLVKPALPFSQCRSNGITATAQQDSLQVGSRCSFGPALFHMLHLFKYGRCGISPKTIGMRLALWQANRVAQISGQPETAKMPFHVLWSTTDTSSSIQKRQTTHSARNQPTSSEPIVW
mgnify:CR=1 FL=1